MTWLDEYTLLWNLACEWDGIDLSNPMLALCPDLSKDNPYIELVKECYKNIIGGK